MKTIIIILSMIAVFFQLFFLHKQLNALETETGGSSMKSNLFFMFIAIVLLAGYSYFS